MDFVSEREEDSRTLSRHKRQSNNNNNNVNNNDDYLIDEGSGVNAVDGEYLCGALFYFYFLTVLVVLSVGVLFVVVVLL